MTTREHSVPVTGVEIAGVHHPAFVYGTAWKEDRTEGLVLEALEAGFRGVDTANQRKHYHEVGVGAALKKAFEAGTVSRDELFLQTKFTFVGGQDHRLPYDPEASTTDQVNQSFASSLEHLGIETLDSYVLHGPQTRHGLTDADLEAWAAMEKLHAAGKTRLLGVSNVNAGQLAALIEQAETPPHLVQQRCFAALGWDRDVREICRDRGMVYQGFSLLTANRVELAQSAVHDLAQKYERTVPQLIYRFAQQIGMCCLNGTTTRTHMDEDLTGVDFEISEPELVFLEEISARR